MSKIEYVGRKAFYIGKSLPQICLKLKKHGIGRMFLRGTLNRYPEVTYFVLTHFEADVSDEFMRRGNFRADYVFRGEQIGNIRVNGGKEDYQLVPKEEEQYFLEKTLAYGQKWRKPTIVPKFVDLPPLLKNMLQNEIKEKGLQNFNEDDLKLPYTVLKQKTSNVEQQ
jgi:hypothetical protein